MRITVVKKPAAERNDSLPYCPWIVALNALSAR